MAGSQWREVTAELDARSITGEHLAMLEEPTVVLVAETIGEWLAADDDSDRRAD